MTRLLLLPRASLAAAPLALLLVALLALAGCREALTGPELIDPNPPDVTDPSLSEMYVKGPDVIIVGESAAFRAELLHEATHYRWGLDGTGTAATDDPSNVREFTLTAVGPGRVVLYFTAYDAEQRAIGYAQKEVHFR